MDGDGALRWLLRVEYVVVATLAWGIVRRSVPRRIHHTPFAVYATVVAVADLLHAALTWALPPHGPFVGAWRLLFHAEQFAYLAGYVALPALAVRVCSRWPAAWPHVVGVGGVVWAALAESYPWASQGRLLGFYGTLHAACFAGSFACVVARTWALRGVSANETERIVVAVMLADAAVLLGPGLSRDWTDWKGPLVSGVLLGAWVIWAHVAWAFVAIPRR